MSSSENSDSEHSNSSTSSEELEDKNVAPDNKNKPKTNNENNYETLLDRLQNDITKMVSLTDDFSKRTELYHVNTERLEQCDKMILNYEYIINHPQDFIDKDERNNDFSLSDTLKKIEEYKKKIADEIDDMEIDKLMSTYLEVNKLIDKCKNYIEKQNK